MALLPEGTRFAIVRHMLSSPMHIAVMVGGHGGDHGGADDDVALAIVADPYGGRRDHDRIVTVRQRPRDQLPTGACRMRVFRCMRRRNFAKRDADGRVGMASKTIHAAGGIVVRNGARPLIAVVQRAKDEHLGAAARQAQDAMKARSPARAARSSKRPATACACANSSAPSPIVRAVGQRSCSSGTCRRQSTQAAT